MRNTKMKLVLIATVVSGLVALGACKDKGKDSGESSAPAPAPVELTGTAAQNMITVFELGVTALKNNSADPVAAAKELTQIAATYDIADLRAKSRAAKEAGQGATDEEKARFKALMDEYKELAGTVGGANTAAFNPAHSAWSRLWGLN